MTTWEEARAEEIDLRRAVFSEVKRSFRRKSSAMPAEALYNVRYADKRVMEDNPDKAEILEDFCKAYWGCTFDELMKLWDEYLG